MHKRVMILALFVLLSGVASAALGISPAKKEIPYIPGERVVINYTILSDTNDQDLEIYVSGGLAQYATLSKTRATGAEKFHVTIDFPDDIEIPGPHLLSVGIREKPPEDKFIGTNIDISGVLTILVPYPGRYAETTLTVPHGNADELIPVEAFVVNRGQENLSVSVVVNFYSESDELVHIMEFTPAFIAASDQRYFRKFLNASGYLPGSYLAEAIVNYGEEIKINQTFRIGSLDVAILNFTNVLYREEGIQKFFITVENRWNGALNGVYASIDFSQGLEIINLRTPPVDLKPWQRTTLVGFVDTDDLTGDRYNTGVTLHYAGQETFLSGSLDVAERGINGMLVVSGIALSVVVILAVLLLWTFLRKKKSSKKQ